MTSAASFSQACACRGPNEALGESFSYGSAWAQLAAIAPQQQQGTSRAQPAAVGRQQGSLPAAAAAEVWHQGAGTAPASAGSSTDSEQFAAYLQLSVERRLLSLPPGPELEAAAATAPAAGTGEQEAICICQLRIRQCCSIYAWLCTIQAWLSHCRSHDKSSAAAGAVIARAERHAPSKPVAQAAAQTEAVVASTAAAQTAPGESRGSLQAHNDNLQMDVLTGRRSHSISCGSHTVLLADMVQALESEHAPWQPRPSMQQLRRMSSGRVVPLAFGRRMDDQWPTGGRTSCPWAAYLCKIICSRPACASIMVSMRRQKRSPCWCLHRVDMCGSAVARASAGQPPS